MGAENPPLVVYVEDEARWVDRLRAAHPPFRLLHLNPADWNVAGGGEKYAVALEAGFRRALHRHGHSPRDTGLLLLDVFYPRADETPEERARNRIEREAIAHGAEIPRSPHETERQVTLRLFAPGGVLLASRLRAADDFAHTPIILYSSKARGVLLASELDEVLRLPQVLLIHKDLESASKVLRFVGDQMGAR